MKKNNPFEETKRLFTEDNVEISNIFFTNKILSYQPDTVLLSIEINKLMPKLPGWAITKILNICIKKRRREPFFNYIKRKKEDKKHLLLREKVSRAFNVNYTHADQIIEIVRKQGEEPEKFFGLKT